VPVLLLSSPRCHAAGLVRAVDALRRSVRQRGGELLLRCGPLAPMLLQLAADTGSRRVVTEVEVEYRWVPRQGGGCEAALLHGTCGDGGLTLIAGGM
jgi:DNA photolyase